MLIYQLHKYGGQWEDSFDYIIGSYLKKERAEEEKVKAEAEEKELVEQDKKCNDCPFLYDDFIDNDKLLSYCSKAKLTKNEYGTSCENYYTHWDESIFKITEVEVEE